MLHALKLPKEPLVTPRKAAVTAQGARNTTVVINISPLSDTGNACPLAISFGGDTSFVMIHQKADVWPPIHHDTLRTHRVTGGVSIHQLFDVSSGLVGAAPAGAAQGQQRGSSGQGCVAGRLDCCV